MLTFDFFLFVLFSVDDVLDGVSMHVGCGYWGTIGVSIFKKGGLFLNPCRATAYVINNFKNLLV